MYKERFLKESLSTYLLVLLTLLLLLACNETEGLPEKSLITPTIRAISEIIEASPTPNIVVDQQIETIGTPTPTPFPTPTDRSNEIDICGPNEDANPEHFPNQPPFIVGDPEYLNTLDNLTIDSIHLQGVDHYSFNFLVVPVLHPGEVLNWTQNDIDLFLSSFRSVYDPIYQTGAGFLLQNLPIEITVSDRLGWSNLSAQQAFDILSSTKTRTGLTFDRLIILASYPPELSAQKDSNRATTFGGGPHHYYAVSSFINQPNKWMSDDPYFIARVAHESGHAAAELRDRYHLDDLRNLTQPQLMERWLIANSHQAPQLGGMDLCEPTELVFNYSGLGCNNEPLYQPPNSLMSGYCIDRAGAEICLTNDIIINQSIGTQVFSTPERCFLSRQMQLQVGSSER